MLIPILLLLAMLYLISGMGCQNQRSPRAAREIVTAEVPRAYEIHERVIAPPQTPSVEEARAEIEEYPESVRAHLWMGLALYAEGRLEEAEPYLYKARRSESIDDQQRRIAARYYSASIMGQGQWSEESQLLEALAHEAEDGRYRSIQYFGTAYVELNLGNLERAEDLFGKSLDAQAGNYEAAWFIAIINAELGRAEIAERYFRQSLEHAPHDLWRASCVYSLGRLAEEAGDYARAVELYERALTFNPRNEKPQRGLREIQRKLNHEAPRLIP